MKAHNGTKQSKMVVILVTVAIVAILTAILGMGGSKAKDAAASTLQGAAVTSERTIGAMDAEELN